jgi:hypothetical protein
VDARGDLSTNVIALMAYNTAFFNVMGRSAARTGDDDAAVR